MNAASMQWLAVVALCTAGTAYADLKVKTRYTSGAGAPTESSMMTKGERERYDHGARSWFIQQHDLRRAIHVDAEQRTYMIMPFGDAKQTAAAAATSTVPSDPGTASEPRRGGVVKVRTAMTDTGERRQMFGYTARHIRWTMTHEPQPGACDPTKRRMEIDGWYIDFELPGRGDGGNGGNGGGVGGASGGCKDRYETVSSGSAKTGYPLIYEMKSWTGDDPNPTTMKMEVLELSTAALDPALFDIPAGFSERGLQAAAAPAQNASSSWPAKRAGSVRIGVPDIRDASGRNLPATPLAMQLVAAVQSAGVDAVPLGPGSPEEIERRAREAQADYILWADVAELKGGAAKKGGMFGRMAGGSPAAKVDYRLMRTGNTAPVLSASASTGSSGGGWRAALTAASIGANVASHTAGYGGGYTGYVVANAVEQSLTTVYMANGGDAYAMSYVDPGMYGMISAARYGNGAYAASYAATSAVTMATLAGQPRLDMSTPDMSALAQVFDKVAKAATSALAR